MFTVFLSESPDWELKTLIGRELWDFVKIGRHQVLEKVENVVERVKRNLKRYWRCF
jgi:hypothetical protein